MPRKPRFFLPNARTHVPQGDSILIPVFDLRREGSASRTPGSVEGGAQHEYHLVIDGDSLWSISKRAYGKGSEWERIYEANRDVLAGPDAVVPGMKLRLP